MIIGVCGYGFTGSGAVIDLLREFSEIQVLDQVEFKLTYMQDGIEDLQYQLVEHPRRFFGSDSAIRRFKKVVREFSSEYQKITHGEFLPLIDEYLASIIDVAWNGTCSFHKIETSRFQRYFRYSFMVRVRKFFYKYGKIWFQYPDKKMYLSISPERFHESSKNLIRSIISAMGGQSEKIVLNQPFTADRPEFSFPFYEDPYAICVSRDPRDLYILAKEYVKPRARFIPTDNVEDFIMYYKKIMENARNSTVDSNKVLHIAFEDLIYNYEQSVESIKSFIAIDKRISGVQRFFPEISKSNTQLFKRSVTYANDIQKIEEALTPWLYQFPEDSHNESVGKGNVF